jgi:hypothetical protein
MKLGTNPLISILLTKGDINAKISRVLIKAHPAGNRTPARTVMLDDSYYFSCIERYCPEI